MGGRYALACVGHSELDHVAFAPGMQAQQPALRHRVEGVEGEVGDDLLHLAAVQGQGREVGRNLHLDPHALLLGPRLHHLHARLQHGLQGTLGELRPRGLAEVQQRAQDALQLRDFLHDDTRVALHDLHIAGAALEHLGKPADGGQRVADLMRHDRRQLADGRQRLRAHQALRGVGQLAVGFFQLVGATLLGGVQPGAINGQCGVVGQGRQQLHIRLIDALPGDAVVGDGDADDLVLHDQRSHHELRGRQGVTQLRRHPGVIGGIEHVHRLARRRGQHRQHRGVAQREGQARDEVTERTLFGRRETIKGVQELRQCPPVRQLGPDLACLGRVLRSDRHLGPQHALLLISQQQDGTVEAQADGATSRDAGQDSMQQPWQLLHPQHRLHDLVQY